MPVDPFQFAGSKAGQPARRATAITANDTTDFDTPQVLYIGTGGDLKVNDIYGTAVTFKNVPDGSVFPLYVNRVYATGTTAADIVGLF